MRAFTVGGCCCCCAAVMSAFVSPSLRTHETNGRKNDGRLIIFKSTRRRGRHSSSALYYSRSLRSETRKNSLSATNENTPRPLRRRLRILFTDGFGCYVRCPSVLFTVRFRPDHLRYFARVNSKTVSRRQIPKRFSPVIGCTMKVRRERKHDGFCE